MPPVSRLPTTRLDELARARGLSRKDICERGGFSRGAVHIHLAGGQSYPNQPAAMGGGVGMRDGRFDQSDWQPDSTPEGIGGEVLGTAVA